ncbi:hypothetical protein DFJ67_0119 [Asanoa ferruginea]|uniref:Uncharacterized protein n=1 Tax=Asanoa ferruginea TaxID=53367 RepID=A0A3D9ZCJ2_9ACTN|nr:hypothetical protein [Asanoa ferruginea]REF94204.1 hypothetical protein DFJ67_0119 [Asanoa ferruginea]GIF49848.1 hypothetical protein Afe04nite_43870 [Asanoa ferruginea]
MKRRALAYASLAVAVVCCGGLSFVTHGIGQLNLRQRGEVSAVVDGPRPGTVLVQTLRYDETWSWLVGDDGAVLEWADHTSAGPPHADQCVATTCYRAAKTALRVEASGDGGATYATSWEIAGEPYAMLAESYPDVGDPAEHLSSRSLVVHEVAGGHVVFVANGRDGLLYRGVGGAWQRLGFPASGEGCCFYESALPLRPNPTRVWLTVVAITFGVVATLLPATLIAWKRRTWRRADLAGVLVLGVLAGYGSALAFRFPTVGMFPGATYGIPTLLAIMVAGALLGALFVSRPARSARPGD